MQGFVWTLIQLLQTNIINIIKHRKTYKGLVQRIVKR